MSSNVLSHFGVLDELIQVIYQGVERFVLLSKIDDASWTVYVGLHGPEGRWWRGCWLEKDILHLTGAKASEIILEGFADKLADIIIKGEASIGDWDLERGTRINLTLGSTERTPVHIPLVELSPEEAASQATNIFWDIALVAQSRKCRLHGSSYTPLPLPPLSIREASAAKKPTHTSSHSKEERKSTPVISSDKKAQEEIKTLKAELAHEKKRSAPGPQASNSKTNSAAPQPHKVAGASLANPNKRVRKVQAIEFESDDDD